MARIRVWGWAGAATVAALLSSVSPACGGDDDWTPGNCPNLAGTWTVREHCEPDAVGTTTVITQSGCRLSAIWEGSTNSTGTVSPAGAVVLDVDTGEGTLHCTGTAAGDSMTVDCTPGPCHVVSSRAGGGHGPGSACTCDSDCTGGSAANPAICVGGVCMQTASASCAEAPGTTAGCPSGLRCWMNAAETVAVCWPDCASFSCVGTCDEDGSCVPSSSTSCNPSCGTLCGGGA